MKRRIARCWRRTCKNLRTKGSLQSSPELSHPLASTRDPGGRTIVQSVVPFLSVCWHVIIPVSVRGITSPLGREPGCWRTDALAPPARRRSVTPRGTKANTSNARASSPGKSRPFMSVYRPPRLHPSIFFSKLPQHRPLLWLGTPHVAWNSDKQLTGQQRQQDREISVNVNVCHQKDFCEPSLTYSEWLRCILYSVNKKKTTQEKHKQKTQTKQKKGKKKPQNDNNNKKKKPEQTTHFYDL